MAKKKSSQPQNPFIYEGYEGPDYFCDRTEETENIISHLQNGRNTTLVSPRKIGKTGLIWHTFNRIRQENKDAVCIYTDIFHTQNQQHKKALDGLKEKDLVYHTANGYIVYDRFLDLWLKRVFFWNLKKAKEKLVYLRKSD